LAACIIAPSSAPRNARSSHCLRPSSVAESIQVVPRNEVFGYTGVQFMQINTLYQLYSMKLHGLPALGIADRLLNTPDLFNYWFTGIKVNEYTDASTSQLIDPFARSWAHDLIAKLGLPDRIFGSG